MTKLRTLVTLLIEQEPVPEQYGDHPLRGSWSGYRDAHLESDWLLIHRVVDNQLRLARTGSHADLFKE